MAYAVNSPRRGLRRSMRVSSSGSPSPSTYISLVTAASVEAVQQVVLMVALIAEMEAVLTSMQDRTVHSMNIILKEMAIWTIS